MKTDIRISNVKFTPASPQEAKAGLRGSISCTLNGRLQLDGITLRHTRGGRMTLSFPFHQDKSGNQRFYISPLDDAVRKVLERQIFQALGIRERSA